MISSIHLYTLVFIGGNLLLHNLGELPQTYFLLVTCAGIPCFFAHPPILKALGFFALGFAWTWWNAERSIQLLFPPRLNNASIILEGNVISIPLLRYGSVRFTFLVDKASDSSLVGSKLRLRHYVDETELKGGDRVYLVAKLSHIHGYFNEGGFDYEKWLFAQRISAVGKVKNIRKLPLVKNALQSPFLGLLRLRQHLFDKLQSLDDKNASSLSIAALVLGVKGALMPWQRTFLTTSGTGHLFAISGLHVGLIFLFFFLVFKFLWKATATHWVQWSIDKTVACMAFIPSLFYVLISGMALPAQRACLFLLFFLVNRLRGNPVNSWQILSTTLMAVVLIDPFATLFASLWLSFIAVFFILVLLSFKRARGM